MKTMNLAQINFINDIMSTEDDFTWNFYLKHMTKDDDRLISLFIEHSDYTYTEEEGKQLNELRRKWIEYNKE